MWQRCCKQHFSNSPLRYLLSLLISIKLAACSETEVEGIVQVVRASWPHPAFCLVHCDHLSLWNRVATRLSQPLLSWKTTVRCCGYQVLGQQPHGNYASLLHALCHRYDQATADQLARDPAILSPRKINVDAHSMMEFVRTGRPPIGATRAAITRIANDLHHMVRLRYIVSPQPGLFSAIHPQPREDIFGKRITGLFLSP